MVEYTYARELRLLFHTLTCSKLLNPALSNSAFQPPSYRKVRYLAWVAANVRQMSISSSMPGGHHVSFIMHSLQSNMTCFLFRSLHRLRGGTDCWPSILHERSSFLEVTAYLTASSRHFTARNRQPKSGDHPASAPPISLKGISTASPRPRRHCDSTRSQC